MLQVRVTSSGRPMTAGELKSIVTRRLQASAREQADIEIASTRRLVNAEAEYATGQYNRELRRGPAVKVGDTVVCQAIAHAPHSAAVEGGRRAIVARRGSALTIRMAAGAPLARASVAAAPAKRYRERGLALARPAQRAAAEKWGAAIASDLVGRVGRG